MKTSGAYLHSRPDGSIFYVGKGTVKRSKLFSGRNPYHTNIVNKYAKENILINYIECSSDKIAFELEIGLIKCLKRSGVEIVNQTNGGDGFETGSTPWNKGSIGVVSAWNKGLTMSEECRKNLSEAHKGQTPWNKGKALSDEHKANLSASKANRKSWCKGKKLSAEHRAKLSLAKKGKILTEEHKAKISAGLNLYHLGDNHE